MQSHLNLECPRKESNLHFKNRNLTCDPLHYEGVFAICDFSIIRKYYNLIKPLFLIR